MQQNNSSFVSSERLELVRESIWRQLRNGRSIEVVRANLAVKDIEPEILEELADEVYAQYLKEIEKEPREIDYESPGAIEKTCGMLLRGLIAWILSVLTGHLVNPNHLDLNKKRDEERVQ